MGFYLLDVLCQLFEFHTSECIYSHKYAFAANCGQNVIGTCRFAVNFERNVGGTCECALNYGKDLCS